MKFEEAIKAMRDGKKVRNDYMKEKKIVMYIIKNRVYQCITTETHTREYECEFFNSNHLFREDWEVVDD